MRAQPAARALRRSITLPQAVALYAGAVVAAAVAQALVVLSGGHYAADAIGGGRTLTFALAAAMLAVAVVANVYGLRASAQLQLVLAAGVALVLLTATVAALPRVKAAALTPFVPYGWHSVGRACVLLFFAFFGCEAITHLAAEFRDPRRDLPRATVLSVGLVTTIYLGVAFAVVATATYGTPALDRVAVAHVLGGTLGVSARWLSGSAAVVISLGTANAFVAATSRLGYALGRDGAFPAAMGRLSGRDVPVVSIFVVAATAAGGLLLAFHE